MEVARISLGGSSHFGFFFSGALPKRLGSCFIICICGVTSVGTSRASSNLIRNGLGGFSKRKVLAAFTSTWVPDEGMLCWGEGCGVHTWRNPINVSAHNTSAGKWRLMLSSSAARSGKSNLNPLCASRQIGFARWFRNAVHNSTTLVLNDCWHWSSSL